MRHADNESQVLAEIGWGEHPNHYPQCRSDRIKQHETPPGHSQYSPHDPVELAQNAKKASEQHCHRAVADIHMFDPAEAFGSETDLCAVAQNGTSSELSADQISYVIAQYRADPRE